MGLPKGSHLRNYKYFLKGNPMPCFFKALTDKNALLALSARVSSFQNLDIFTVFNDRDDIIYSGPGYGLKEFR